MFIGDMSFFLCFCVLVVSFNSSVINILNLLFGRKIFACVLQLTLFGGSRGQTRTFCIIKKYSVIELHL